MKKKVVKLEDLELEVYKNEMKLNKNRVLRQKTLDEFFKIVISKKEV